jgi:enamine deaminase RidA (YjgF/YER057c/UK114 family)
MNSERWGSGVKGRNHTVAHGNTVWTVSNARNLSGDFAAQVLETFAFLDASLSQAGSSRQCLLSVQVMLADIKNRDRFDELWCQWVGDNPAQWPQRAVFGAALAPGLLVEIVATASRA